MTAPPTLRRAGHAEFKSGIPGSGPAGDLFVHRTLGDCFRLQRQGNASAHLRWHLAGTTLGIDFAYTIGDEKDLAVIRVPGSARRPEGALPPPATEAELLSQRRLAVASSISHGRGYTRLRPSGPAVPGPSDYRTHRVWIRAR